MSVLSLYIINICIHLYLICTSTIYIANFFLHTEVCLTDIRTCTSEVSNVVNRTSYIVYTYTCVSVCYAETPMLWLCIYLTNRHLGDI